MRTGSTEPRIHFSHPGAGRKKKHRRRSASAHTGSPAAHEASGDPARHGLSLLCRRAVEMLKRQ